MGDRGGVAAFLAIDLACVLVRLEQLDAEGKPEHWLWDRVMTCDVPRLRAHLARLDGGPAALETMARDE